MPAEEYMLCVCYTQGVEQLGGSERFRGERGENGERKDPAFSPQRLCGRSNAARRPGERGESSNKAGGSGMAAAEGCSFANGRGARVGKRESTRTKGGRRLLLSRLDGWQQRVLVSSEISL